MTISHSLLHVGPTAEAEVAAGVPLAAATIPVGGSQGFLTVSPNGKRVYVPVRSPSNTVAVIDTSTNAVVRNPLTFGRDPQVVAVAPNGNRVYATNSDSNTVSVIDTATNAVVATIPVGNRPGFMAVARMGDTSMWGM